MRDLPPPVGMSASTSLPDFVALIISRWFSLNVSFWKISLLHRSTSISQENSCCHSDRLSGLPIEALICSKSSSPDITEFYFLEHKTWSIAKSKDF